MCVYTKRFSLRYLAIPSRMVIICCLYIFAANWECWPSTLLFVFSRNNWRHATSRGRRWWRRYFQDGGGWLKTKKETHENKLITCLHYLCCILYLHDCTFAYCSILLILLYAYYMQNHCYTRVWWLIRVFMEHLMSLAHALYYYVCTCT